MEMLNRAIEDASDYMEMHRKMMQEEGERIKALLAAEATASATGAHEMLDDLQKMEIDLTLQEAGKRPGESRQQYRARMRAESKGRR